VVGNMDKMLKTVTHPFVPDHVAFARREIMLTQDAGGCPEGTVQGQRCDLRFLDAAPYASKIRAGDWIVSHTGDDERHLWQIVDATRRSECHQISVKPTVDSARMLFAGSGDGQMEALYYSRLTPAKYYLDVLGLYLLNLVVANSPVTVNDREKINAEELGVRMGGAAISADPNDAGRAPGLISGLMELFQGGKNQLRDIFTFVAYVYLKLTWHDSSSSYYGTVGNRSENDLDPSEFLLEVVNDAKGLRNKVEEFLSVPRNTFENEWPTERRLGNVSENAQRDFEALVTTPLDIKQMMIELIRLPAA